MGRVYLPGRIGDKFPEGGGAWCAAGLLLCLALTSLPEATAAEGIYRYVDPRGVVHFTNVNPDDRFKKVRKPRGLTWVSSGKTHTKSLSPGPASGPPAAIGTYDPLIARHSRAAGIPPALVKAVIHAESAFDRNAVSPKGAMGLMQLMPATARSLGVEEPFRAGENIAGGTRYLRTLHDRYGSWTHTLAAYNAGPTAVDKYRGIPPYDETRTYVKRVLSFYRRYHGDFPR